MPIGLDLTEIYLAGCGLGNEVQKEGFANRHFGNVDLGRLRVCAAGSSAFHKGASVRLVAEWK